MGRFCIFRVVMLLFCGVFAAHADELVTNNEHVKINLSGEAKYYKGQIVKATKEKAQETGFYKMYMYPNSKPLFDGDLKTGISSHLWSRQAKRIIIDIDLGAICELTNVEFYFPAAVNRPQSINMQFSPTGYAADDITSFAKLTDNNKIYQTNAPLSQKLAVKARYVKITAEGGCPRIVISELKLFGKRTAQTAIAVKLPAETWHLPKAALQGHFYTGDRYLLVSGERFVPPVVKVLLPVDKPVYIWARYIKNKERSLQACVNGRVQELPDTQGLQWKRFKDTVPGGREIVLQFQSTTLKMTYLQTVVFTTDPDFDLAKLNYSFLKLPAAEYKKPFIASLLEKNPKLSGEELRQALVKQYGLEAPKIKFYDENSNILYNGKPFFPLSFCNSDPQDSRLYELPVNTFLTLFSNSLNPMRNRPARLKDAGAILTYWTSEKAYDSVFENARANADRPEMIGHYLMDEPGLRRVPVHELARLNASVKAGDPRKPTMINVAPPYARRDYLSVTDIVCFDEYPIPGGSIASIGRTTDRMRLNSGNKPVMFFLQTFDWGTYGRKNSRYQTPDETSAMFFTALVHNIKGLISFRFTIKGRPQIEVDGRLVETSLKEDCPKLWERLEALYNNIGAVQDALFGAEFKLPYKQKILTAKKPEFRIIVSKDLKKSYILVVNPYYEAAKAELDFSAGPLADIQFCDFSNYGGVKINKKSNAAFEFDFPPLASGIFAIKSGNLAKLEKLSNEEILAMLAARLYVDPAKVPKITIPFVNIDAENSAKNVPWDKALDLLTDWRSENRMDSAKIIATREALHIKCSVRYSKELKSKTTTRDTQNIFSDRHMEVFLAAPKQEFHGQLVVNSMGTQADLLSPAVGKLPSYTAGDFKFYTEVSDGYENVDYAISIPWDVVRKITGQDDLKKPFRFNLTGGTAQTDFAGLTGDSYHTLARYAVATIDF